MIGSWWLVVAVLALPAAGALLLALLPGRAVRAAPALGTAVAALTFLASLGLLAGRHGPREGRVVDPWHAIDVPWIPPLGVRLSLGVDGISAPLVILTALLVLLCAVYTLWTRPAGGSVRALYALMLIIEVGILGTFLALDLVVFFVAFEITLLPMYALIAGWGGPARRHAATKFVLYTLAGSVLLLVGILLVAIPGGTDLLTLSQQGAGLSRSAQITAFVVLALAFAVKSPLWPLHTWLPDAHTEAPTVGSVLLAGVLLKMGTYGFIRIAIPVLPEGARAVSPYLAALATAAILVGAFCCLTQIEIKRLIAYSSVGHMGFVLLGVSTLTATGIQAALIGNIAHGIVTGLLFFLAGAIKDRYGTGLLTQLSGLGRRAPVLAGLLGFIAVASLGLPGLAGFWGELFAIVAAWQRSDGGSDPLWTACAVLAALGAALAAAYFLRLLRIVVNGEPGEVVTSRGPLPVRPGEWLAWGPLAALTLVLGLLPALVLDLGLGPVQALVSVVSS
ncbi:MAG TPA: NADH-quinone oxidoreductase subunit M [Mycobacteriales bacterium]|nr:NADH-quinone oxidoreductase subunit M [Mycobacteriales bacterium]